jgi:hypothetical protein
LQRQIGELEAFDPSPIAVRDAAETKAMQANIAETLAKTFGKETADCKRYASAARLDHAPNYISARPPAAMVVEWVQDGKAKSLALLHQAVKHLKEELAALGKTAIGEPAPSSEVTSNEPSPAEGEGEQKPETKARQPNAAPGETAIGQSAPSGAVTSNEPSRAEGQGEQKPKTKARQSKKKEMPGS